MTRKMPPPGETRATVTMFKEGHRTYERRYVDCNKPNCQRCNQPGGRVPSHGPYWYLCVPRKGKWYRIYLGKVLDTSKYVDKNGNVDWKALDASKKQCQNASALTKQPPGQEDMIDQTNADSAPAAPRGPAHIKMLEDDPDISRHYAQDPLPAHIKMLQDDPDISRDYAQDPLPDGKLPI